MVKGNPAETFQISETGEKDKSDKDTSKDKNQLTTADGSLKGDDLTAQVIELAKTALEEKDRNDGKTTARDKLKALLEKIIAEAKKEGASGNKGKEEKKSKTSTDEPSWFWKWMVGIKFLSQLKSKVKKAETLTATEKWVVVLYRIYKFFEPPFKHTGKFTGKLFIKAGKGIWDSIEKAVGKTAKGILDFILPLILIGLLIWGILVFFHFAVVSPLHWIESKVKSGFHWEVEQTPVASPPANVFNNVTSPSGDPLAQPNRAPEKKTKKTIPTVAYQPSVSFSTASSTLNPSSTLYDPKILESEILSLPQNCIVKDYPLTPDEGMPGDVAVSRMQDITDPDKYTLMIGGGKQIISSVNPTNTTLRIYYKNSDPFGLLGGSNGPIHFLWEDVLYIHANEVDILLPHKSPQVIYQCSLVVSGSKIPLTLQCATAADLEHLVSTLQYFIRSSRLGHDTALGGMPYLYQGLMLNSDRAVEKLWANSPIDKAGVVLGDHLWSIGKVTAEQQEKKVLEAGLRSASATFFTVSPSEWQKAQVAARHPGSDNSIHPKLRKVVLTVF